MTHRVPQPAQRASCRIGRGWLHPHRSIILLLVSFFSRRLQVDSHSFLRSLHLRRPDSVIFQHYHILFWAEDRELAKQRLAPSLWTKTSTPHSHMRALS